MESYRLEPDTGSRRLVVGDGTLAPPHHVVRAFVETATLIILALASVALLPPSAAAAPLEYLAQMVASGDSGDCKAIADFDGDGRNDLAVGGDKLAWYKSPSWTPMVIGVANSQFTTDMEAIDLDGDGDIDIVVPDGTAGVYWFENQNSGQTWTRRLIGTSGSMYTHDVEVGDIDGDGDLDVVGHPLDGAMYVYRNNGGTWAMRSLASSGGEGLKLADIDQDGRLDLVTGGQWHRAPAGDIMTTAWPVYVYDSGRLGQELKIGVADLDGDGRRDIAVSPAEGSGEIAWLKAPANPLTGAWTRTVLRSAADRYHSLVITDLDANGWLDIVTAQMHTATDPKLEVYLNSGSATTFTRQVLASASSHNLVVGDLNSDGKLDLAGCNYIGYPPVRAWLNQATYISAAPPAAQGLTLSAAPNPFNARVNVTFAAPGVGSATLRVYDLKGRLVRELWSGVTADVATTLTWNGLDDGGAAAASGVYHLVLSSARSRQARSIALVK
ncbi:MAG: VCBS repeat-containing protein [bacterium]|nr:VCBS repeat-containing protein [bacterium]